MVSFKSHMTLNFKSTHYWKYWQKYRNELETVGIKLYPFHIKKKKVLVLKYKLCLILIFLYQYALFYLPGTVNKVEQLKSVLHL